MSLGKRLLAARKAAELTQEDVATRIGISRAAISQWELDETQFMRADNFFAVCNLYGVTPDEMLGKPRNEAELTGQAVQLAHDFDRLSKPNQKLILSTLKALLKSEQ